MRRSSHRAEVEQDGEMMLVIDSDALATLARRHHVSRLSLFGSAATESFDPERSDADFLVEFSPESPSPFEDYFRLKIGRASCRERGEISVLGGSLKIR